MQDGWMAGRLVCAHHVLQVAAHGEPGQMQRVKCNRRLPTPGASSSGAHSLGAACSTLLLGNTALHIEASTRCNVSAPSSQILALILLT